MEDVYLQGGCVLRLTLDVSADKREDVRGEKDRQDGREGGTLGGAIGNFVLLREEVIDVVGSHVAGEE